MKRALIIGGSDGIGLAVVRGLLARGWAVAGCSRSPSPVDHPALTHRVVDVRASGFSSVLAELVATGGPLDACIYCAGIGERLDPLDLGSDVATFEVNLMGALRTAAAVVPAMVRAGKGHLVVLSSQADEVVSATSPSYGASKAGVSAYFEGLGLALRRRGVRVTNVRLGFVETKMAKGRFRPFQVSADRAASVVLHALEAPALRVTFPLRTAVLVAVGRWLARWQIRLC
jgi:NAD(P)-dependent dehydrogenase (short-subunit alcohol dehydrogenase family)